MKINTTGNQIIFTIKTKLYPLDAVYGASYAYLDRAFLFLDEKKKGEILVSVKSKEKMSRKQLQALAGDFQNELLNYSFRATISNNNKKLRETILGRALLGALDEEPESKPEEEEIDEWKGDHLGLSIPWEEKVENKLKKKK